MMEMIGFEHISAMKLKGDICFQYLIEMSRCEVHLKSTQSLEVIGFGGFRKFVSCLGEK